MADLMNGSTKYTALANKYQNFMVPAVKIKVQGTDLVASLHLLVEQLSVVHALDTAGSCQFTLFQVYDLESRQFQTEVLRKFQLGTILEVELGYGSATTLVFKGFVSEMTADYSEFPALQITAMDVRRLMQQSAEQSRNFTVKTYSDVFKEVMQAYQKICTNLAVDKTDTQLNGEKIYQTHMDDFTFLKDDLARKAGREFFVLAGKAYFRKPAAVTAPITELTWGESLLSFRRSVGYLNASVTVLGKEEEKNTVYTGTAKAVSGETQKSVTAKPQVITQPDPDATDSAQVKQRAEERARQEVRKVQTGSGSCIGLPEIVPGRYIALQKLGNGMDRKYYIDKVRQEWGSDGFITHFEVKGWES